MVPKTDVVLMGTNSMVTVAGGAVCESWVDTRGYDYGKFIYLTGVSTAAAGDTCDACELAHNDTLPTAFTTAGYAILDGCDGTAGDFTLPTISSTHASAIVFNVDLRGKKRYIAMRVECDATHTGAAIALLTRKEEGEEATTATTAQGVRTIVSV